MLEEGEYIEIKCPTYVRALYKAVIFKINHSDTSIDK